MVYSAEFSEEDEPPPTVLETAGENLYGHTEKPVYNKTPEEPAEQPTQYHGVNTGELIRFVDNLRNKLGKRFLPLHALSVDNKRVVVKKEGITSLTLQEKQEKSLENAVSDIAKLSTNRDVEVSFEETF